jgi:hypothetical protein
MAFSDRAGALWTLHVLSMACLLTRLEWRCVASSAVDRPDPGAFHTLLELILLVRRILRRLLVAAPPALASPSCRYAAHTDRRRPAQATVRIVVRRRSHQTDQESRSTGADTELA